MADVAFAFEYTKDSANAGIADLVGQALLNLRSTSAAQREENVHDLTLAAAECEVGGLRSHGSIAGEVLDVVNHQNLHGTFLRLELDTKLLPDGLKECCAGGQIGGVLAGRRIVGPFEREIPGSG